MKVAIYGRVSTKDKGQDVENQLLQLRRFVASQPGWSIYHVRPSGSGSVAGQEGSATEPGDQKAGLLRSAGD